MANSEEVIRNIDGEIIDFTKDDLIEKLTYESANLVRRLVSYVIDLVLIIVIWYLMTRSLFTQIDAFVKQLGINEQDYNNVHLLIEFIDLLFDLYAKMILYWLFIQTLYFTLVPAIIGNGQTIGKLLAGIGVVHAGTLEEISPTRLIFREFICRGLIEGLLIIPGIISCFISFFREDSRSLHDMIAKTVVIKLDLYDVD